MRKEIDIIELMKEMEKEMPLLWKIKIIPYRIWSKLYLFYNIDFKSWLNK